MALRGDTVDFLVEFPEEDEHDHEEERIVEVFSLDLEDGEIFFEKLEEVERKDKTFWICQKVFLNEERDEIIERGDYVVFEYRDGYISFVDDETTREILENFNNRLSP